jgi:Fur family ferric uptake transcriptional regulator
VRAWEERLADAGFRITAPRRAVIAVLRRAEAPLSPQDILEHGGAHHPRLGLTTVYRTLALLQELDLVRKVHRADGCHGYVAASPGHRHHVVCRRCGRTVEFPGFEDLAAMIAQVERTTAYRVENHLLQLSGLCPRCQEEAGKETAKTRRV